MSFTLRPYQREAVEATLRHFRRCRHPAVIVLPTGAGKSLIIAELARVARGRVLVLAHVKELIAQNHSKYQAYGLEADIFAAGLKRKQQRKKVVFGSIQSVARNLQQFDTTFSLLIVDECHRIGEGNDSQYRQVLHHLQQHNPQLAVLGLTATPCRLDTGWIYQFHYHGMVRGDNTTLFRDCIYELPLRYMIKQGYLVTPVRRDMPVEQYDFSRLKVQQTGYYSEAALNHTLLQQQRITPYIVRQITELSARCKGVMIFAATRAHAKEVLGLLPDSKALISADTSQSERDACINAFKNQQLRFIVNVAVLTTGFDAPHVDLIAILRPTESVSLYQQIIGRGLRLSEGKQQCLILDYAGNRHDLYTPDPGTPKQSSDSQPVQVCCPACGFSNTFWGKIAADGSVTEHFGRRCQGIPEFGEGKRQQCDFRFRFKICPHCDAENDIAARHCHHCKAILADADDMLKTALKLKGCLIIRCGGMQLSHGSDASGEWVKASYFDEDGCSVSERFRLNSSAQRKLFALRFLRLHQRAPGITLHWQTATEVVKLQSLLRHPDFVVAHRCRHFWQIREKIFDYRGRFRLASQLS